MDEADWLSERFGAERSRLVALAYRMLGSRDDAEDAVQESWMRLTRTDHAAVQNLGGWLTTVVSRVCLDQLRARRTRDSQPLGTAFPDQLGDPAPGADPEHVDPEQSDPEQQALLAESVGMAMLVVLDALEPAERVAFVLHDMFAIPFDQIGIILDRSPAATRQLASRARRRVRGQEATADSDRARQAHVVEAFLAASRRGDFGGLLALLDPDVVLRADETAVKIGVAAELRGAADVGAFCRRAGGALAALVNGEPGAVWMPGGRPRVVFSFTIGGGTISRGTISGIGLTADRDRLAEIDLVVLEDPAAPGWLQ
jgi:RNA polymerase sigma factor (sigma-70 family)